jgi:proteic killer suppression protein
MIKSFLDKESENLYITGKSKKFQSQIVSVALRKLDYLNNAIRLEDLKAPPANRLEKLKGDLKDFYSIRINKQYRIIFKFINGNAYDVSIVDYH